MAQHIAKTLVLVCILASLDTAEPTGVVGNMQQEHDMTANLCVKRS